MNIERLRQTLRRKWLSYYRNNRSWLVKLGIWVSCDGHRRPSSSFILATVSVLEPRLTDLFPLIVDLSHDPDRVVQVLGLDFDPDEVLASAQTSTTITSQDIKMLPSSSAPEGEYITAEVQTASVIDPTADQDCQGKSRHSHARSMVDSVAEPQTRSRFRD